MHLSSIVSQTLRVKLGGMASGLRAAVPLQDQSGLAECGRELHVIVVDSVQQCTLLLLLWLSLLLQ